jgi:DNA-binding beta-propeller fold protein YncE
MKKNQITLILLTICFFNTAFAQKNESMQVLKTFGIGTTAGWDYLEVGPKNNCLYVSHGTQVNVINKITGDSITVFKNTTGVHGIAFDVANNKGYISNGKLNNVFVFNILTNEVIDKIATGKNPDAIFYEPFSKKIITCNGKSKNLSIISTSLNKVTDSVALGGKPETAVSNNAGKIFINIEDKNEIVVVDTKTFTVLKRWSIAPGESPTGLAIDTKTNRLFTACENMLLVVNATNGNIVAKLPIGKGCDGVAFDQKLKIIYASNSDGTLTIIHEDTADKYTVTQNLITKKGARTIALDKETHYLYLPTAELEPTEPNHIGKPKMKPGTFQVLVVGKK